MQLNLINERTGVPADRLDALRVENGRFLLGRFPHVTCVALFLHEHCGLVDLQHYLFYPSNQSICLSISHLLEFDFHWVWVVGCDDVAHFLGERERLRARASAQANEKAAGEHKMA